MPSWTLRRKSRRVECQRVQGAGVETVVPTQREGERASARAERATVARRDDEILDKGLSPERGACWKS